MFTRKAKATVLSVIVASVMPLIALGSASAMTNAQCLTTKSSNATVSVSGTQATATFTVPSNCGNQEVSLVSYETPSAKGTPLSDQKLFKSVTNTYAPGSHTVVVEIPNCFFQVDLVQGIPIQKFDSTHTYHKENRFLAGKLGGTQECTTPTPTPTPTPTSTPTSTTPTTPTSLPNTGSGNVFAVGIGVTVVAAALHAAYRKFVRAY